MRRRRFRQFLTIVADGVVPGGVTTGWVAEEVLAADAKEAGVSGRGPTQVHFGIRATFWVDLRRGRMRVGSASWSESYETPDINPQLNSNTTPITDRVVCAK
jgi:hypothetical protein